MPLLAEGYNAAIMITDKFTKLIGMIAGRADWDSEDWALGTLSFWPQCV
ncbi:Chromo domain-like [Penicillium camemberti]|uniref:Chromo domain-like n=1 Tax=Penicillium camemberti (strain FM 013) TaxID=1429867 RepID=A0A0G4P582_PENC3|nr:Chromo domain-like [Penicillium camemberti]